jgi:coenzyme F420-0:L-glutamate ligase/coenzyme F420-1:gamma-L-glutamate ligase
MSEVRVVPLTGIPEVGEGDDVAALVAAAAERAGGVEDGDVVVVAQKVVSKAEGRVVDLDGVDPSPAARALAGDHDPRHVETVLRESARLVRARRDFLIAETRHGFVCASAGVDASNAPAPGRVVLLPADPDESASRLRARLQQLTRRTLAVLVTDSFGRAWRQGTTDVAVGAAGLQVLLDLKGTRDSVGYELRGTTIAVADEIAGAAELVIGKTEGVPAALVRGLAHLAGEGRGRDLVMPPERDLFR